MQFDDTYSGSIPSTEEMARDKGLKKFLLGVYQKMALGLIVTGLLAYAVANSTFFLQLLYTNDGQRITGYTIVGYIFAFAPLALSFISGMFMNRLNAAVNGGFFWAFVAIMGVSLSSIAIMYAGADIARAFFISAATFGAVSLFGYTTKVNMTGWGTFLSMGVLGLIVASLASVFLGGGMGGFIIGVVGVLLFSALIAYQTQGMKLMYYEMGGATQNQTAAITYIAALGLYINFINLFISFLRIFGGGRD